MTGEVKLLPCPFCGSENIAESGRCEHDDPYARGCATCWALGPSEETEAEAITAWNTRPTLVTGQDDAVKEELLDCTPTGAYGLPRWKFLLRADAACLGTTDQTLAPEYRKHLAQRLSNFEQIIEALVARTGVTLNG